MTCSQPPACLLPNLSTCSFHHKAHLATATMGSSWGGGVCTYNGGTFWELCQHLLASSQAKVLQTQG